MHHHHIAYCLLVYCNILPYCNIWLDFVKNHFMGTSCTQLHMFYVANKSRESETSAYYNLYTFVCYFIFQSAKTTQYPAHTYNSIAIYCNCITYSINYITQDKHSYFGWYQAWQPQCPCSLSLYHVSPLTEGGQLCNGWPCYRGYLGH